MVPRVGIMFGKGLQVVGTRSSPSMFLKNGHIPSSITPRGRHGITALDCILGTLFVFLSEVIVNGPRLHSLTSRSQ
uniref:Uncharacterized protein n=1 Tax=Steinernema glaseri TaxID=37863 RepID=A0A1I7ZL54_9BILA